MKRFSCYLVLLAMACAGPGQAMAASGAAAYTVQSVMLEQQAESAEIRIFGNSEPTYTAYRLFSPDRLVIDIADARLAEHFTPPDKLPAGPLHQLRGQQLAKDDSTVRLELLLAGVAPEYEVKKQEYDIVVSLRDDHSPAAADPIQAGNGGKQRPVDAAALLADLKKQQPPSGITEHIQPRIPPLSVHLAPPPEKTEPSETAPAAPAEEQATPAVSELDPFGGFDFGGYTGERISIDYFKTDLHNVFRLFGEVSNRNIVVDEAVQGTLTLSLNQVPWDFALDVIINLKDLQKEERFNTIVISPADKQFTWKAEAIDTGLTVRADPARARETLAVEQRLEVPQERIRAQELIRQANAHSRRGEHLRAISNYEEALRLWPDNSQLAERLAAISLVHQGNNARAANFARRALQADPQNHHAALLAAIALANMQRSEAAKEYFDQAIDRPQPDAEALVSYAAFAEEHDSPHGALALLARHQQLYGDTLETMLARARLLDRIGASAEARREYQALLYSGYELPEDLSRYIVERTSDHGE